MGAKNVNSEACTVVNSQVLLGMTVHGGETENALRRGRQGCRLTW